MKKAVLDNFAKFIGKHLCRSLFFVKLQPSAFLLYLKRDSCTGGFPWILRIFTFHFFCGTSEKLLLRIQGGKFTKFDLTKDSDYLKVFNFAGTNFRDLQRFNFESVNFAILSLICISQGKKINFLVDNNNDYISIISSFFKFRTFRVLSDECEYINTGLYGTKYSRVD